MITTGQILARLQTAFAADATLLAAVAVLYPSRSLTMQLGSHPLREISAQDCPFIGLLGSGRSETGRRSAQWSWPIELHCVVCDDLIEKDDEAPTGTVLLNVAGQEDLDTFSAAVAAALQRALDTLSLNDDTLQIELESPIAAAWPRQRAIINTTIVLDKPIGMDLTLPPAT